MNEDLKLHKSVLMVHHMDSMKHLIIDLWDGTKACSNWENGLHQKWTLEEILPPLDEPTAEELVAEFYKKQEHNSSK